MELCSYGGREESAHYNAMVVSEVGSTCVVMGGGRREESDQGGGGGGGGDVVAMGQGVGQGLFLPHQHHRLYHFSELILMWLLQIR